MNRKATGSLVIVVAVMLSRAASAEPPVIAPGRWEVTIKTILRNATPTTVTEVCISKERAAHPEPAKGKPTDDCHVTGGMNGNLLKYEIKCGRKNTTSKAEFTYHGDRYEGVVTLKNEDFEVQQIHTAKRIGECDSGSNN